MRDAYAERASIFFLQNENGAIQLDIDFSLCSDSIIIEVFSVFKLKTILKEILNFTSKNPRLTNLRSYI